MNNSPKIKTIILLSDGIAEHDDQSRGVAIWISKLTGAEILETRIPELSGVVKLKVSRASRILINGNRKDARDWLALAFADVIVRQVGQWFAERNFYEGTREVLIISAGSDCSPYNLALGYMWRCVCATIATPKTLGTDPFDFAIIPEYEFPPRKTNVLSTLGLPNTLTKKKLNDEAIKLLKDYTLDSGEKWTIIIGGDDKNHIVKPDWIKKNIGYLMRVAEIEKVSLYISVIGNITKEADETIKLLISRAHSVKEYFSENDEKKAPLPLLLSYSDEIFCTENKLNIILETLTAGKKVVILRMDWKKNIENFIKKTIASMVGLGAVKQKLLLGHTRHEILFGYLGRHNYVVEFNDWRRKRHTNPTSNEEETTTLEEFNEAKRAANWIVSTWNTLFN